MNHKEFKNNLFKDNLELKKEYDNMELEYTIINALIEARINNNLTQKELSKITGIDQSNISKIEKGIYNPTLNTLKKIADGLNLQLKIEFVPKN